MAESSLPFDLIAIVSAFTIANQDSIGFEILDDALDGSFGDADACGDIAKDNAGF